MRGRPEGRDIISPARFDDIRTRDDLRRKVDWLREQSGRQADRHQDRRRQHRGRPGVRPFRQPDFITLDGRAGATGAAPKSVKDATSIPTIFALHRARKFLTDHGADHVSLVITGGLRVSSDFAKALALGADAVAIGTAALMAAGCQQYRICNTGRCPVGVTSQDPELRGRLQIDESARRLENFLRVSTEELKTFARLTGNDDVHKLAVDRHLHHQFGNLAAHGNRARSSRPLKNGLLDETRCFAQTSDCQIACLGGPVATCCRVADAENGHDGLFQRTASGAAKCRRPKRCCWETGYRSSRWKTNVALVPPNPKLFDMTV